MCGMCKLFSAFPVFLQRRRLRKKTESVDGKLDTSCLKSVEKILFKIGNVFGNHEIFCNYDTRYVPTNDIRRNGWLSVGLSATRHRCFGIFYEATRYSKENLMEFLS